MTAGRFYADLRRSQTDRTDLAVVRHHGPVVAVRQTKMYRAPFYCVCTYVAFIEFNLSVCVIRDYFELNCHFIVVLLRKNFLHTEEQKWYISFNE